jgi:Zn ribbon nucleic-acid-binding protein
MDGQVNMKYCKKCGWKMDYRPRSFQEQIREIIGEQVKKGFWKCPNCGFIIKGKNAKK